VPASTAKSRIQTVTRTDSSQAEAAGFGKLAPEDKAPGSRSTRPSSSLGSRPSSMYNEKDEAGIPEIGVQVPMFRNAGDVQAPSPAPSAQQGSSGVGFHNKTGARHHGRTKSGREIFHGPPGSYGLHGHGKISQDDFEKKWYEKHPDDFQREKAGEYGPHIQENRKDYHWRSENLEQLVHGPGGIGLSMPRTTPHPCVVDTNAAAKVHHEEPSARPTSRLATWLASNMPRGIQLRDLNRRADPPRARVVPTSTLLCARKASLQSRNNSTITVTSSTSTHRLTVAVKSMVEVTTHRRRILALREATPQRRVGGSLSVAMAFPYSPQTR
jgi:hypothetical protein